ncbi:MAG: hypothetical protein ACNS61_01375 [Candidatus Wenzhouxiangella sp. M2_3B_020]
MTPQSASRSRAASAADGRSPRLSKFAPVLAALSLLAFSELQAHSVEHEVTRAESVLIVLSTGPDQPFAAAGYRIYRPEGGEPFATGITDRNGRIAFRPDRGGTWRVIVSDSSGHGASIRIDVDEAMGPTRSARPSVPRLPMLLAGIGYVLGAAGIVVLLKGGR